MLLLIKHSKMHYMNVSLINKEKAELGNIKIEFQYYETNELHPLAKVAKRRQQGIEVIRDVKHLAVS